MFLGFHPRPRSAGNLCGHSTKPVRDVEGQGLRTLFCFGDEHYTTIPTPHPSKIGHGFTSGGIRIGKAARRTSPDLMDTSKSVIFYILEAYHGGEQTALHTGIPGCEGTVHRRTYGHFRVSVRHKTSAAHGAPRARMAFNSPMPLTLSFATIAGVSAGGMRLCVWSPLAETA